MDWRGLPLRKTMILTSDGDSDNDGKNAGVDKEEMLPDMWSSPTQKHKQPPLLLPPTLPKLHLGLMQPRKKKPDTTAMATMT
jgi:hypothetical protein